MLHNNNNVTFFQEMGIGLKVSEDEASDEDENEEKLEENNSSKYSEDEIASLRQQVISK